jgi:hypothetical protein
MGCKYIQSFATLLLFLKLLRLTLLTKHSSLVNPSLCSLMTMPTYWANGTLPEVGATCEVRCIRFGFGGGRQ